MLTLFALDVVQESTVALPVAMLDGWAESAMVGVLLSSGWDAGDEDVAT